MRPFIGRLIGRRKLALALAVGLTAAGAVPVVAAAATPGTTPAKIVGRYVALGDSVPYGFGLANPTTTKHSGLPPNQPPSRDAYPSVLAKSSG